MRISDTGVMELVGMEFHSNHGCLESERVKGNLFVVDLKAGFNPRKAAKSDDLADTIDYGAVYELIRREMDTPSNLLEHIAGRIAIAIAKEFDGLSPVTVTVAKQNPPVGGVCAWSKITVSYGEWDEI